MPADRADDHALEIPAELICPQCESSALDRRHCRTLCEECGYVESCEDSFLPNRAMPSRQRRAE